MDKDTLDKNYSPSRWSKRALANEVIELHCKFVEKESKEAKSTIPFETLRYGDGVREEMDIFGTDLKEDVPLFVYVHGGCWQELNKDLSAYCVQPLYRQGYRVAVLGYNLCPDISLEQLVQQIIKAVIFLFENYGEKSRHISLSGHSAGAHLIASILNHLVEYGSPQIRYIKYIYLISGLFDLNELRHSYMNENNLLKLSDENVNQLSPVSFNLIKWKTYLSHISFYIYVAENDSPTFIEQSEVFAKFLSGLNIKYHLIDKLDHFDIVENLADQSYEITQTILSNY